MGKIKNGKDFKPRSRGKDKKKNTFKKFGKNSARSARIKQAEAENKAENMAVSRKNEGDHLIIATNKKFNNKGKTGGKHAAKMCKTTRSNKK